MKNKELRKIKVCVIDKYDKDRYYEVVVAQKNATKNYVLDLLRKQSVISVFDRVGFNRSSGNIVKFYSNFELVDAYNNSSEDTILDNNW